MSSEQNITCIEQFYQAFAKGDAAAMISCYHDEVDFEDPAFGKLKGDQAKAMWQMLINRSKGNLAIEYSEIIADELKGQAQWIARYPFGPKKRNVVNRISASFVFQDGKIIKHTDVFDLWRWSQQALGLSGYLLGWTSFFAKKIQKTTNKQLADFMAKA